MGKIDLLPYSHGYHGQLMTLHGYNRGYKSYRSYRFLEIVRPGTIIQLLVVTPTSNHGGLNRLQQHRSVHQDSAKAHEQRPAELAKPQGGTQPGYSLVKNSSG